MSKKNYKYDRARLADPGYKVKAVPSNLKLSHQLTKL